MRYNEWQKKLADLQERTKNLIIDEELLCESVTIGGDTYEVFLGTSVRFWKNGKETYFNNEYSAKEKGWQKLLGGLETKVTMAEALHPKLLNVLVKPYLKEAVLDRLTGVDDVGDNEAVIKKVAAKRIDQLEKLIPHHRDATFNITLKSPNKHYALKVNSLRWRTDVIYGDGKLKANLSLLENYDAIRDTVAQFASHIKAAMKLVEED